RDRDDPEQDEPVPARSQPADEHTRHLGEVDRDGGHRATATDSPVGCSRPPPRQKDRRTRQRPARSHSTVGTMSTRESRSSTQSTGTPWMRSPFRSASSRSSLWPESSGATSGRKLSRFVERSTSM